MGLSSVRGENGTLQTFDREVSGKIHPTGTAE